MRTVAYFVNFQAKDPKTSRADIVQAIYGREHHPQDLPADKLTHVLYAFANIRPETGEVYLTDPWSDVDKHYPDDSWNDPLPGPNLYGCMKRFALLKRSHRNLKTLLSIGGWTYSSNFAPSASNAQRRQMFADSAVTLLKDCGFDGLDIDWEYPSNESEARNFVELLRVTRQTLDKYAQSRGLREDSLLLTVACPAAPDKIRILKVGEMDPFLSAWHLMGYDFSGSWDTNAGHLDNVFSSDENPQATPFSIDVAVRCYTEHGVRPDKIIIGCPLYGRAFCGTQGPGTPYTGGVGEGSFEAGVWDWKVLPKAGSRVTEDDRIIASWSLDSTRTMISFDTLSIVKRKAEWVKESGLGGIMWWESSGDRKPSQGSAIGATAAILQPDYQENIVDFPDSKYANMRNGFR